MIGYNVLRTAKQFKAQNKQHAADKLIDLPAQFTHRMQQSVNKPEQLPIQQTDKYLQTFACREERLRPKLGKEDSAAASTYFVAGAAILYGISRVCWGSSLDHSKENQL